jgi:membrane associated rhomboid family serine protease
LGSALSNIIAANGCRVVKTNIVNDRGIHICKSMLAWLKWGNGATPESTGMEVEWGSKRFLIFYLLCGIGAGLTQELCQLVHYEMVLSRYSTVNMGGIIVPMSVFLDEIVTVGASGAVYGILLGYGLTFPNNALFIIPFPFPIKAKWLVIGYVILELGLGIRQNAADNVAHFAHLGGMLAGFLIMLYWKRKDRRRDDNNMTFSW